MQPPHAATQAGIPKHQGVCKLRKNICGQSTQAKAEQVLFARMCNDDANCGAKASGCIVPQVAQYIGERILKYDAG